MLGHTEGRRGHNEPPDCGSHMPLQSHTINMCKRQPCAHTHTHIQGQAVIEKQHSKLVVMTRLTEGHFADICFLFLNEIISSQAEARQT